jgi:hypothetical protein
LGTLRQNDSHKFTDTRQAKPFYKTTDFLNQLVKPQGFIYKDVTQPFVVSDWIKTRGIKAIYIKRNIADVAYSMLAKRWEYPAKLFPEVQNKQVALIKGLVSAQTALNSIPAIQLDFEQIIFDERPLRETLPSLCNETDFQYINYIDEQFEKARDQILNRRKSESYKKIGEIADNLEAAENQEFLGQLL